MVCANWIKGVQQRPESTEKSLAGPRDRALLWPLELLDHTQSQEPRPKRRVQSRAMHTVTLLQQHIFTSTEMLYWGELEAGLGMPRVMIALALTLSHCHTFRLHLTFTVLQ